MVIVELINLKDLQTNFRIVKIEKNLVYLKLYKGRYTIRIKLPFKPNEKLALLFGHILGDGCIKSREESACYTNKSKELVEEFKKALKELFGIEVRENFNSLRKFYHIYAPKIIAKFLVLCGFPKGEKTKEILKLPHWIKVGSPEIKRAFIRALFDDEATVINSKKNRAISFGLNKKTSLLLSHKEFIEEIREILFSLGIEPNKIFVRKQLGNSVQLGFHIYKRYNLINFLKNIGFTDKEKRKKLVKAINSYKNNGKSETKRRILNLLKATGPLKTKELCFIIGRDRNTIWKNLHKLEKESLIEKILMNKIGPIEKVFWKIKNNLNTTD